MTGCCRCWSPAAARKPTAVERALAQKTRLRAPARAPRERMSRVLRQNMRDSRRLALVRLVRAKMPGEACGPENVRHYYLWRGSARKSMTDADMALTCAYMRARRAPARSIGAPRVRASTAGLTLHRAWRRCAAAQRGSCLHRRARLEALKIMANCLANAAHSSLRSAARPNSSASFGIKHYTLRLYSTAARLSHKRSKACYRQYRRRTLWTKAFLQGNGVHPHVSCNTHNEECATRSRRAHGLLKLAVVPAPCRKTRLECT